MKKIFSAFLILGLSPPFFTGCDIFNSDASSDRILERYNEIVGEYDEVLFTRPDQIDPKTDMYRYRYYIEYGNKLQSIIDSQETNLFTVFSRSNGIYPELLNKANRIFLENQERLLYQKSDWNQEILNKMDSRLDKIENGLSKFDEARRSLEMRAGEMGVDGNEIDGPIHNSNYKEFVDAYNNLIYQNLEFSFLFEQGLKSLDGFEDQETETIIDGINSRQVEFSKYRLELLMTNLIYEYHIVIDGVIDLENYNSDLILEYENLITFLNDIKGKDLDSLNEDEYFARDYFNFKIRENFLTNNLDNLSTSTTYIRINKDDSGINEKLLQTHKENVDDFIHKYLNFSNAGINLYSEFIID